ncbi:MAG: hypothetical protein M3N53_11080 [Actinomycetota bacterium]|nr:hypothetical protein [Actinomycetota bacterium]
MSIALLMVLTVGTIQVALTLYGRNVVQASAHEGLRAMVERGAALQVGEIVATRTVQDSVGSLVQDLEVDVVSATAVDGRRVLVRVTARLRSLGPLPLSIPVTSAAQAFVEGEPE